jgi:uncharacterized cupredoxin-like copper-binding protein
MEQSPMTVHAFPSITAGATALAFLAFHSPDQLRTPKASTAGRVPPVITVTATDYRLALPETLAAGPTTFRVVNHGSELHHLLLVRLDGGHTSADLARAMKGDGPPPEWAHFDGGPNGVSPHQTSLTTTVDLSPGHYAVLCMIPGPDGVPHVAKGMLGDVDVRAAGETAPLPSYDGSISLFDYGFKSSTPITHDTRRVLVRNDGVQPHELELARLLPGKTLADLSAWAKQMAGPPPAEFLGGVSPIAPGGENVLSLSLPPGHYVMLCFLPDATDHAPHVAHGMVHDFVVR